MIRDATYDDIGALVEKGRRFADAIKSPVGFCEETAAALVKWLIDDPNGIMLVGYGGGAGGLVHPSMFNKSHLTGQELFWWVDPEQRGGGIRLFDALEKRARDLGAQSWMVSTMEALNFVGASKLYERRGYCASDRNFIKIF